MSVASDGLVPEDDLGFSSLCRGIFEGAKGLACHFVKEKSACSSTKGGLSGGQWATGLSPLP